MRLTLRQQDLLDDLARRDEPATSDEVADTIGDDPGAVSDELVRFGEDSLAETDHLDRWSLTDRGHALRSRSAAQRERTDPAAGAAFAGRSLDRELRWRREAWRAGIKVILPAWIDTEELAAASAARIAEKLATLLDPPLPIEVAWFREEGIPAPDPPFPPPGGVYRRCRDGAIICVPEDDSRGLGVCSRCGDSWRRHGLYPPPA